MLRELYFKNEITDESFEFLDESNEFQNIDASLTFQLKIIPSGRD